MIYLLVVSSDNEMMYTTAGISARFVTRKENGCCAIDRDIDCQYEEFFLYFPVYGDLSVRGLIGGFYKCEVAHRLGCNDNMTKSLLIFVLTADTSQCLVKTTLQSVPS